MANETASPTVPVGTLAKLFNLTEVRVQQLAKMNVTVKAAHGRYDLWASIKGYLGYLQDRAGVKAATSGGASQSDDPGDYNTHRARLYRAKADQAEIEVALAKGRVHEGHAVEKVWSDMRSNARSRLLAMPPKYSAILEGMTDRKEIQKILEDAIYEALNELSEYDPSLITRQLVQEPKQGLAATPEGDGEPMGGPEQETVD